MSAIPVQVKSKISYRKYYNISEYRSELWNKLKDEANALVELGPRDDVSENLKIVKGLVDELSQVEKYWPFRACLGFKD
jgi:predicted house-cleaning noncanonical NTP pyrophosphatase (MazG superfamily)